jgi:hypothetical protein
MRHLVPRIRGEGDQGICHNLEGYGQIDGRRERKRVLKLYQEKYSGFEPTLSSEKRLERDKFQVSKESLQLWLKVSEILYEKRKKRPDWPWRILTMRRDAFMVGFMNKKGTVPATESFKLCIMKHGFPMVIFAEKHSPYRSTGEPTVEKQLEGTEPMSQVERSPRENPLPGRRLRIYL